MTQIRTILVAVADPSERKQPAVECDAQLAKALGARMVLLHSHGPNRLPEPPRRRALTRLLLQFHNILIYVLLGSAVITAAMSHLIDTLVILAVVIVNAVIGFIQEGKAEKAMDAIRHMLAPHACVMASAVA